MRMWKKTAAALLVLAGIALICWVVYQVITGEGDGRKPFAMLAGLFTAFTAFVWARNLYRESKGGSPEEPQQKVPKAIRIGIWTYTGGGIVFAGGFLLQETHVVTGTILLYIGAVVFFVGAAILLVELILHSPLKPDGS